MCMPPHMPKISELFYKIWHCEIVFQTCVAYQMSQFKSFSNLDIAKKLASDNNFLNLIVYFIQVKVLIFSWKHMQNKGTNGWKFNNNDSILDIFL